MNSAYRAAEFAEAARIFDVQAPRNPPYETVLWRARIYAKKEFSAAIRFLIDRPAPRGAGASEAERQMLLGMAYGRAGDHELASEHFQTSYRLAQTAKLHELQSEIIYWHAREDVTQGDLTRAETMLADISKPTTFLARVRVLDLQSLVEGRRKRYQEQAATLSELLAFLDTSRESAPEFAVWATHTLAALGREIYLPKIRPVIESQLEKEWPRYFRENRFQTEKALAWTCALQGDYFNAFRYLKAATQTAPDDAWRTMALLDRAYLAKCIGEPLWSRQEIAEAEEAYRRVDWRAREGEERIALLLFAELFAPVDRGKAAFYLAEFGASSSLRDPLLNLPAGDDRLLAIVKYAHGVVELALNHRKQGLRSLRETFEIFDRVGYDWRAGRAALRLFEATRDRDLLSSAKEKLRRYSASWLGQELMKSSKGGIDLTRMQEKVFLEVCRGLSTSEIAQRLKLSESTVRNHLRLVFEAFGVNRRTALLAEASRRDMLPQP